MRRERPDAKIILMSGGAKVDTAEYLAAADKLGATATLGKVDIARLLEILPELLTQT